MQTKSPKHIQSLALYSAITFRPQGLAQGACEGPLHVGRVVSVTLCVSSSADQDVGQKRVGPNTEAVFVKCYNDLLHDFLSVVDKCA